MDLGMTGLRVLVTAGAAGIGRSIVEAFAEEGARVFTCDVDATGLATLPEGVGHQVTDVADRAQVASLFDSAIAALGGLDVLASNAGTYPQARIADMTDEDIDLIFDVNVKGTIHAVQAALPADLAVFAAAVADWRPEVEAGTKKIKKDGTGPAPRQPAFRRASRPRW